MLTLSVQNFGPIEDATVALKPFTLFVGPNNAGKSYLATLVYALFTSSRIPLERDDSAVWRSALREEANSSDLIEWTRGPHRNEPIGHAPQPVQDVLRRRLLVEAAHLSVALDSELRRCLAGTLNDILDMIHPARRDFSLRVSCSDAADLQFGGDSVRAGSPVVEALSLDQADWNFTRVRIAERMVTPDATVFAKLARSSRWIAPFLPDLDRMPRFFPAARSGLLQGYKPLVGALVSRSDGVRLPGTVRDFISQLVTLDRRVSRLLAPPYDDVARFVEERICGGQLDFEEGTSPIEAPEIYYKAGQRFPIHRVSSTVSEMAPIVLFLRHVIGERDVLIIEEPEAHLHPDNQRRLAQALVKLVRKGLQIVVTTHSDYFVEQVSNFVRLGPLPDMRTKLGYDPDDYLSTDEVGAYLFRMISPAGPSRVEPLAVSAEDGIPADAFARITEALYDETTRLAQVAANRSL